jgi:hypothetical protein
MKRKQTQCSDSSKAAKRVLRSNTTLAQDKADRKAAAAAQKAAAVVQARTQQQEYVGWWTKCEDCGRWRVMHSINWAERDFHCGNNKRLCSQPADTKARYPDEY